ncbi:hypothetical protein [Caenibius sp. WL]|uniref:hypothetical protein n=1 Tax=Caenibius sp. WL TaxID=2872646 RepID=UPI001C99CEFE|nr:hypothetical protein [Caenibius sp. WL]QZP08326.1 hypothetical protein K5X80_00415 [Caenibius sp. WL]
MIGVSLIPKRSDFSREQFKDYYENVHSRLGMKYFKFSKYLRNHVIEASPGIWFDVFMQCRMAPDFDHVAVNFDPAIRAIFDEDEHAFMTPEDMRSGSIDERVISGPAVDIAPKGARRQLLLIRKPDGVAPDPFDAALAAYGLALADEPTVGTVTVGVVNGESVGYSSLPYDAVISLWLKGEAPAITALPESENFILDAWILAEVCEDEPAMLAAAFGAR